MTSLYQIFQTMIRLARPSVTVRIVADAVLIDGRWRVQVVDSLGDHHELIHDDPQRLRELLIQFGVPADVAARQAQVTNNENEEI